MWVQLKELNSSKLVKANGIAFLLISSKFTHTKKNKIIK